MKARLGRIADDAGALNERLGRTISWLVLLVVLLQLSIVVLRYVFGIGSVMMQEAVMYGHASLILLGAGYALRHDSHVRCDIFYRDASPKIRALIDMAGYLFFLLPFCVVVFWVSIPYVVNAWVVLEGSPRGDLGLPALFLLKSLIPVFAVLLALQGLAMALKAGSSWLDVTARHRADSRP